MKRPNKKLRLGRTTIRTLTAERLGVVIGGGNGTNTCVSQREACIAN